MSKISSNVFAALRRRAGRPQVQSHIAASTLTSGSVRRLLAINSGKAGSERTVKVYVDDAGEKRLVGRADIPDDVGAVYEVRLFGLSSAITDQFIIGSVTHLGPGSTGIKVERAILLGLGQRPEILPGWQPLAS